MPHLRRTLSLKDTTWTSLTAETFNPGLGLHSPPPTPLSAATSTPTTFSQSVPSTAGFPFAPTVQLPTLHVFTQPSLTLHLRSRARSPDHTPAFYGGDFVSGHVQLNLPHKEAQYVTSVDIEASLFTFYYLFLRLLVSACFGRRLCDTVSSHLVKYWNKKLTRHV